MDVKLTDVSSTEVSNSSSSSLPTKRTNYFESHEQKIKWMLPRLIAFIYVVILFLWIYEAEGGIGSVDSNLFGWHALLMSFFIVILMQEAVLAYSAPLLAPFKFQYTYLKYDTVFTANVNQIFPRS